MREFTQLARFVTQAVHKREATIIAADRKIDLEQQQEISRSMHQSPGRRRIGTTQSRSRGYSP
jgi:hypothetical protein